MGAAVLERHDVRNPGRCQLQRFTLPTILHLPTRSRSPLASSSSSSSRGRAHAYIHTYMHTYIHTHMHICTHACIHTCMHAHMHICKHAHMCTTYIHAYMCSSAADLFGITKTRGGSFNSFYAMKHGSTTWSITSLTAVHEGDRSYGAGP